VRTVEEAAGVEEAKSVCVIETGADQAMSRKWASMQ
jgi:hypothetical protein